MSGSAAGYRREVVGRRWLQATVAATAAVTLEVQQAFVAHVSRVGLPVPPAYVQQADVEIYGPIGAGGMGELIGEKIAGGIGVAEQKGQEICVLTPECVDGTIALILSRSLRDYCARGGAAARARDVGSVSPLRGVAPMEFLI